MLIKTLLTHPRMILHGLQQPTLIPFFLANIYHDSLKDPTARVAFQMKISKYALVSFPKSGRTWLRIMVGKALREHFGFPKPEQSIWTYKLMRSLHLPGVFITHDGADPREIVFPKRHNYYRNKVVIFLRRDIRDTLVSYWHHKTAREGVYAGSLSEFIRSDSYGVKRLMTFYQSWYQSQSIPAQFLTLSYEEMHNDPKRALQNVLAAIQVEGVRDAVLRAAVEFGSFENMRKLERSDHFAYDELSILGDSDNINGYKTRRGKIGGYVDELSDEDLDYIYSVAKAYDLLESWLFYDGV